MSELRSKYPQAQAWTFALSDPSSPQTKHLTAASRAGSSRAATILTNKALRVVDTEGNGEMGLCCSSNEELSRERVANKENAGRPEDAGGYLVRHAGQDSNVDGTVETMATNDSESPMAPSSKPNRISQGGGTASTEKEEENCWLTRNRSLAPEGVLDSTSILSPESSSMPSAGNGVELASTLLDVVKQYGSDVDDEVEWDRATEGERLAWLERNLNAVLGGKALNVTQLKIPRLEDYLHELLSDRKRFLKTIEALTNELVKREADADKRAHERKALKMKVTMLEQDKQALEHGARAATDEHRSERARWAAHKQELETRCAQLEGWESQFKATLRKKEADYGKLQDGIRRVMAKESRLGSRGMEATSELPPLSRNDSEASTLGDVVDEHHRRQSEELERENAALRSMLVELKGSVMDLQKYQEKHGDLVSAARAGESGEWGGDSFQDIIPGDEAIEGMPAEWLQERLGEGTARQILIMRGAVLRVLGEGDVSFTADSPVPGEGNDGEIERITDLKMQLKEARALLREQDVIMLAAIFDKPGVESAITAARQRCVCGGGQDPDGYMGSMIWDTHERLEQEREELDRQRAQLEAEKASFLEDALRRDNKSFEFECLPAIPTSPPVGRRGSCSVADTGARESVVNRTPRGVHRTPGGGSSMRTPGGGSSIRTPDHWHRHMATVGTIMVSGSPCVTPMRRGDGSGPPLLTFTPPGASPETARLLGAIGIKPGNPSPKQ